MRVVAVVRGAGRVGEPGQVPDAVGALVVLVGDRLRRAGAAAVADAGDAVQGVVGIGRHLSLGVKAGEQVAGRVMGIGGGAGVGALCLAEVAQAVAGVLGGEVPRIGDPGQLVQPVVGVLDDAVVRVGDLVEAVERIIGIGAQPIERVGDGDDVAVVIVGVGGGLVDGADVLLQMVQCVEHAAVGSHQGIGAVVQLFLDAVAGVVQRIGELVAQAVGNLYQPMGRIVGIAVGGARGQGDVGQVAHAVVGVAGDLASCVAAGQAPARVIGQAGNQPVRIGEGAGASIGVIPAQRGGLGERVADGDEVVLGVVAVVGDVGGIGARTVHGQHLACGVVGPGPGTGGACCGGAQPGPAGGVSGGLDGFAEQVALEVVAVSGDAQRFGNYRRQSEARVPLGGDLAHDAADRGGRHVAGQRHRARRSGGHALKTGGLEIAGQVIRITCRVAVEVGAAGDIAVGVVGKRGSTAVAG